MRSTIIVKTQFNGRHQYIDAPEEVMFLRQMHDHTFFVEVEMDVTHDDRELEFFIVRRKIDEFIIQNFMGRSTTFSCETMAKKIGRYLTGLYGDRNYVISVFEDNANGGRVYYKED